MNVSASSKDEEIARTLSKDSVTELTTQGCLFVGDLSIFCKEEDMTQAFQIYGDLLEVKVMRCDETHKNLCYGFVKFVNSEDALAAMEALNGALLCGRPMRISWASHRSKGKGTLAAGPTPDLQRSFSEKFTNTSSVHFSYSSNEIDEVITEETLRSAFAEYGEIHDITIKKFEIDQAQGLQRGYGFVHFPASDIGIKAALACAEGLKDHSVHGIHFKCDVSHKLLRQLKQLSTSQDELSRTSSRFSHRALGTTRIVNHSQSSELSDIPSPSIDLSSMSMESLSGGPPAQYNPPQYYYPAMMFPSFAPSSQVEGAEYAHQGFVFLHPHPNPVGYHVGYHDPKHVYHAQNLPVQASMIEYETARIVPSDTRTASPRLTGVASPPATTFSHPVSYAGHLYPHKTSHVESMVPAQQWVPQTAPPNIHVPQYAYPPPHITSVGNAPTPQVPSSMLSPPFYAFPPAQGPVQGPILLPPELPPATKEVPSGYQHQTHAMQTKGRDR